MYNNEIFYDNFNRLDYNNYPNNNNIEDRFFLGPLIVGGLAGTALGYGIANNNQLNNNCCNNNFPMYPFPYYNPYYQNYNPYTNPYNIDIYNNYY